MSEPPITVRERLWAGGLAMMAAVGFIVLLAAVLPDVAPAFTMAAVGIVLVAGNKPRPILRWVKRWAPDWLQLP